ncbi:MAG: DUF2007 domain-containing protein [Balneolaceae bacterium]|nr:DUF2007 domain-containing protein [Balneolaceae bacterium]
MSLFDHPKPNDIENWVCVLESGTEYEVDMAQNYLKNLKIPSNILSKRDTAYSLQIGEMSSIYLYVPVEFEKKARQALEELDDAEFEGFEDDEEGDSVE